jgi:hypothetical protein
VTLNFVWNLVLCVLQAAAHSAVQSSGNVPQGISAADVRTKAAALMEHKHAWQWPVSRC